MARATCGEDVNLKITSTIRLRGKQDGDQENGTKPRLLLVKFETKEDADQLYQARFGLKDAGQVNVYINGPQQGRKGAATQTQSGAANQR